MLFTPAVLRLASCRAATLLLLLLLLLLGAAVPSQRCHCCCSCCCAVLKLLALLKLLFHCQQLAQFMCAQLLKITRRTLPLLELPCCG
jgi:hypothetical protein